MSAEYSVEEVRARFESWVQTTAGWKACKARNKPMHLRKNADGSYNDFRINDRWWAYKAAYAERIKADEMAADYPECSGDPASCPENEGFGCCKAHAEAITLHPPAQAAQVDEVGELLAIIHGDGGHYQAEHGQQKAAKDAQEKVIQMMTKIATAEPVAQGEAVDIRSAFLRMLERGNHRTDGDMAKLLGRLEHMVRGDQDCIAAQRMLITDLKAAQPRAVPDVAAMVNRFLGWRLPDDFCPDAGISFTHVTDPAWTHDSWPIGTNLFTAAQAEQMFRYVLAASASQAPTYYCTHCKLPSHTDTDHADCEDAAASRAMLAAARSPGESNTADQEADR